MSLRLIRLRRHAAALPTALLMRVAMRCGCRGALRAICSLRAAARSIHGAHAVLRRLCQRHARMLCRYAYDAALCSSAKVVAAANAFATRTRHDAAAASMRAI